MKRERFDWSSLVASSVLLLLLLQRFVGVLLSPCGSSKELISPWARQQHCCCNNAHARADTVRFPLFAPACDSRFCWCWVTDTRTQMASVDRPRTEDVEEWGLTGERAAQFGMVVRWVRTRLATHERASEATSRCVYVFPRW